MKKLMLTILMLLALTGCGKDGAGNPGPGPTPTPIEYNLASYYETTIDTSLVQFINLDEKELTQVEALDYSVDGVQCEADVILNKPGATNLYHLQIYNTQAIQSHIPGNNEKCAQVDDNFWMRLTSDYEAVFERVTN